MLPHTTSICVLDDQAMLLQLIGHWFEAAQLPAVFFERSQDLLAYAAEKPVELAIVDVVMPKISGLEVLQKLRQLSPAIKVIMMTGRPDPAVEEAARNGGAVAFLPKPFNSADLLTTVQSAFGVGPQGTSPSSSQGPSWSPP